MIDVFTRITLSSTRPTTGKLFVIVGLVIKLLGFDINSVKGKRSDSEPRVQHLHFSYYNTLGCGNSG